MVGAGIAGTEAGCVSKAEVPARVSVVGNTVLHWKEPRARLLSQLGVAVNLNDVTTHGVLCSEMTETH